MASVPCEPDLLQSLQERAARAQPAESVRDLGGWKLRLAPGCSWWIGTVLPHGAADPGEMARRVDLVELFYADRTTSVSFQITPGVCPDGLDAFLAERGYRPQGPVSLQVAPTARVIGDTAGSTPKARLFERPTRAWFETWRAVHLLGGDANAQWALLGRLSLPSAYAAVMRGDEAVSVGRAVRDDGWVGMFGMATLPHARGTGAARSVLAALAEWASSQGAERMYLQVGGGNLQALRLYERMGFTEVCAYHYRRAE